MKIFKSDLGLILVHQVHFSQVVAQQGLGFRGPNTYKSGNNSMNYLDIFKLFATYVQLGIAH